MFKRGSGVVGLFERSMKVGIESGSRYDFVALSHSNTTCKVLMLHNTSID